MIYTTNVLVTFVLAFSRFVSAIAVDVTFQNSCEHTIQLYDNRDERSIAPGEVVMRSLNNGFVGMFRHGRGDQATLAEFSIDRATGRPWYDLAIIPAGPGYCSSLSDCKRVTNKVGFNVAMQIRPLTNIGRDTCTTVTCMDDGCPEAYQFPKDDSKTHNCPVGTNFQVIFCPGGSGRTQSLRTSAPTPEPTPTPTPTAPSPKPTFTDSAKQTERTIITQSTTGSTSRDNSSSGSEYVAPEPVTSMIQAPTFVSRQPESIVKANTQTAHHTSSMWGTIMAVLVGIVALVVAVIAVIVRSNKQRLLHMQPKSPLQKQEYGASNTPC